MQLGQEKRRSIESVLRFHPKAKITLHLIWGDGAENQPQLLMSSNAKLQVEQQFSVFNQAGYEIR